MTDTSGFQARVLPATTGFDAVSGPLLTETYWGFTLRKTRQLPSWIVITQVISFLLGAAFIAAALGFWFVPDGAFQSETWTLRAGLCTFFTGIGLVLVNYANRGVESELQSDHKLGEVREVLRNRSGKSVLVSHFGFDAFTGLVIDRSGGSEQRVRLILRHENGFNNFVVGEGTEAQIGVLYGRLDRDMLRADAVRTHPAVHPVFN